jgi:hypothetical protein
MSWARLLKRVFDIDIEHCPCLRLQFEDYRCHRGSAGDCQDPQPSRSAQPRPAARAGAAIRFIPNSLRAQTWLPPQADGTARSEFERAVRSGTLRASDRCIARASRSNTGIFLKQKGD